MTIIIFLLMLTVLVFVHELGHFFTAKKFGVRVDEFAIGFPPTLFSRKKGETKYSLNLIPIGGYVKIFGENGEPDPCGTDDARSFIRAKRWKQAIILVAGVFMNFLIAWPLFTFSIMGGMTTTYEDRFAPYTTSRSIIITSVKTDSPATKAGLKAGDEIISVLSGTTTVSLKTYSELQNLVKDSSGEIIFSIKRAGNLIVATATPISNVNGDGNKGLGVGLMDVAQIKLPFWSAVKEGFMSTYYTTVVTIESFGNLIGKAFTGKADMSQLTGPVGLVGVVGAAQTSGWAHVLGLMAMISVNLAVLNLIPFPALDGGRLIVVGLEAIIRRPINTKVINTINGIGFLLLILLMIIISVKDVSNLF